MNASGQIRSVQALRAMAALFVVAFHASVLWHDRFEPEVAPWQNGTSGVDLFFVISGFIMVVASQRLAGLADGWRRFISLRLVRIVPLYWIVTALKLAALGVAPALALHSRPTAWNVVASFLFIPSRDGLGYVRAVVPDGWSLSFEVLFYLLFAVALGLARDPLVVVAPVMLGLACASQFLRFEDPAIATLADPMVLEFVAGLMLGRLFQSGWHRALPPACAAAILLAGLAGMVLVPVDGQVARVAIWGACASCVLFACISLEQRVGPRLPEVLVRLGEASYALYLVHGFILPLVGVAVGRCGLLPRESGLALVVVGLLVSIAAAVSVHYWVEVPVTAWLRRCLTDRRAVRLGVPETAA